MIHGPVMRFSGQMLVALIGQLYLVSMNTLCGNQWPDQFLIVVQVYLVIVPGSVAVGASVANLCRAQSILVGVALCFE